MGYLASAVNVVSCNPCIGLSPRIKISFFWFMDELILAPKIMAFFPMLPSGNKNSEHESNPIP